MPIVARELTALEVEAISTPGTHAVGGVTGLCLQVTATGARTWLLRITVDHRRRELGLGAFPTVTVLGARNAARSLREKIGQGVDPALHRRAASAARRMAKGKTATFKACAEAFFAAELTSGRNARYVRAALRDLERLAFPVLGRSMVESVTTKSILGVLAPIWTTRPAVATKLRGSIERVLAYAIAQGFREGINPASWKDQLDRHLAPLASVQQHERHAHLLAGEVPEFFAELNRVPGISSLALRFLILTASRPKDVREMKWSEINLQQAIWTLPSEQSRTLPSRSIPLSKPALRLLADLPQTGPNAVVFATPRSGHALSDMSLTAVLRRMNVQRRARGLQPWTDSTPNGREIVPAGFRDAFRSWAAQTNQHARGAEYLSTSAKFSERVPSQTSRIEATKGALEAWALHCTCAVET